MANTEVTTDEAATPPKRRRAPASAASNGEDRKGTAYVILKGVEVTTSVAANLHLVTDPVEVGEEGVEILWVRVRGEVTAGSRAEARRKYLDGLPEGEGRRSGLWKAVAESSWSGETERVAEVTKPVLEREMVDA